MLIKYKTSNSLKTQKYIPFSYMEQIKHLPPKTVYSTSNTVKKPKQTQKRKEEKRKKNPTDPQIKNACPSLKYTTTQIFIKYLIWGLSFMGKGPNSLSLRDKSQLSTYYTPPQQYHSGQLDLIEKNRSWCQRLVKAKCSSATGMLLLEKLSERKTKKLPLFCLSKGLHFNKLRARLNPNLTAELHGTNEPKSSARIRTHIKRKSKLTLQVNLQLKGYSIGLQTRRLKRCMFCYWKWAADQEHVDRILLVH